MYNKDLVATKRLLAQGTNPNTRDAKDNTPLLLAIPDINLVNVLLDAGAKVHVKNHDGMTPFMAAASCSDQMLLQLLLQHNAHIDDHDVRGFTPLMHARDEHTIRFLIDNGADVNARNEHGETALIYFGYQGYPIEAVKLLIEAGADINAQNDDGKTALSEATDYKHEKMIQELIEHGAHKLPIKNY